MRRIVLKVVAVQELLGGALGLLLLYRAMFLGRFAEPGVPVVASVLFFMSAFAGAQLLRDRPSGYWFSTVVQFAQLPKIVVPGAVFVFSTLGDVSLLQLTTARPKTAPACGIILNVSALPSCEVGSTEPPATAFGVSLVSLIALTALRKPRATDEPAAPVARAATARPVSDDWVVPAWMKVGAVVLLGLVFSCVGCTVFARFLP